MNAIIRPIRQLFGLVRRVANVPRITRRDLELLDRWNDHGVDDGAADALESRLFFDPTLLRAAHQAQLDQRRERRAGRLLAVLLVGIAAFGVGGELQADEGDTPPTEPVEGDDGDTVWDWLDDLFTTSDDKGGGSSDPETGEG